MVTDSVAKTDQRNVFYLELQDLESRCPRLGARGGSFSHIEKVNYV